MLRRQDPTQNPGPLCLARLPPDPWGRGGAFREPHVTRTELSKPRAHSRSSRLRHWAAFPAHVPRTRRAAAPRTSRARPSAAKTGTRRTGHSLAARPAEVCPRLSPRTLCALRSDPRVFHARRRLGTGELLVLPSGNRRAHLHDPPETAAQGSFPASSHGLHVLSLSATCSNGTPKPCHP